MQRCWTLWEKKLNYKITNINCFWSPDSPDPWACRVAMKLIALLTGSKSSPLSNLHHFTSSPTWQPKIPKNGNVIKRPFWKICNINVVLLGIDSVFSGYGKRQTNMAFYGNFSERGEGGHWSSGASRFRKIFRTQVCAFGVGLMRTFQKALFRNILLGTEIRKLCFFTLILIRGGWKEIHIVHFCVHVLYLGNWYSNTSNTKEAC